MGSVTQLILGSTKSVTLQVDWTGNGKKVIEIDKKTTGKVLTFKVGGHNYSEAQVLKEFEKQRHFTGESGSGTIASPIAVPGASLTFSPKTGLSNGDVITITVTAVAPNKFKGAATGTISYTIPANAMKQPAHVAPSFTGTFHDSTSGETPQGTAAQKEAEYMRITTRVEKAEFYSQNGIGGMSLPDVIFIGESAFHEVRSNAPISLPKVETIGTYAFRYIKITSLSLPLVKHIGKFTFYDAPLTTLSMPNVLTIGVNAFYNAPLTSLYIPKATTIADNVFGHMVNQPSTTVTMLSKFNTEDEKNRIFGPKWLWDKITFNWV